MNWIERLQAAAIFVCGVALSAVPFIPLSTEAQGLIIRKVAGGGGPSPGTANLLAWWALDEAGDFSGSPNSSDSHTGALHLTKTNTPVSGTGNVSGGAAHVTADSDYFSNAAFDNTFHDSDFSCGGWVKWTDTAGLEGMLGQMGTTTATRHWSLAKSGGTIYFEIFNTGGGAPNATSNASVTAGTWTFIVGVKTGTTMNLWIGKKGTDTSMVNQTDTGTTGAVNTDDQDFEIGRYSGGSYAAATFDGLFVFTDALTEAELNFLYNEGNGRAYSDLSP